MPTPYFNKELLKLRRRLGDARTEDGIDITETNVGSLDGNIWRVNELVDIYNDAVRDFLEFVVTSVPKDVWYAYLPGYIRSTVLSSQQYANPTFVGVIDYNQIVPTPFFFIGVFNSIDSTFPLEFIPIPPNEYLLTKAGKFPKRRPSENELYYTVFTVSGFNTALALLPPADYPVVSIMYIKTHIDLVVDGDTDLLGINGVGLRKIIDFAEAEAYKQKQAIAPELIQKMLELKAKTAASNVGAQ
jgi:hypothetical protein